MNVTDIFVLYSDQGRKWKGHEGNKARKRSHRAEKRPKLGRFMYQQSQ